MNFDHTDDRRMLADSLDRFIAEQYPFNVRDRIARSDAGYDATMWSRFAELGTIGALFSEEDGGFGGAGFDIAVVFESLGRGLVVEPFLGTLVAGRAITLAGTAAQKATLAELIDASVLIAFAHDEPGSHYELSHVATRAEKTASGWVLNGAKSVVALAEHAGRLLVSARTAGEADGEAGISLFLAPADLDGIKLRTYPRVDGGRAADITFTNVTLPEDALLGEHAGQAYAVIEQAVGDGVLALCAEALGAMSIAKDHTLEYLRTRKQFGKPIGSFQALQHRMADMLLELEQARSAVINAAANREADRVTRERALSAAKYSIGKIGTRVAEECIQMHGGIGMTWELPLSHYAKRLVMIDHQFGDEDHHLERYIALGRSAA
jgi:alkylation response protein AidB-like acyl-CoA dehydrogenase